MPSIPKEKSPAVTAGRAGREPLRLIPAPVLLGAGIVSVQVGAGIAGRTFSQISAAGLTGLRLWAGALLLAGFGAGPAIRAVRDVLAKRAWRDAVVVAGFGLTLGVMNFAFYQAIARIPLGIAVTIEFLGPLAVAVASSRRLIDLVWVALAGTGVVLLGTEGVSLPSHHSQVLPGVLFALLAATGWAGYILLSAATGRRFPGSSGLMIAMAIAAVVVSPAAILSGGRALLRPSVIGVGVAIGLLSSVIPYRCELETLRRIPARVFGIAMSLEPAIAALIGLAMLSQALSAVQWLAIGCVVIASGGAARGAGRSAQAPQA